MEKKIFETRLETLLLHKDFNALVEDDKKYVLTFLTKEEYQEYSFLLSHYKPALLTAYIDVQPDPKVLETLSKTFRKNHTISVIKLKKNAVLLLAAASILLLLGAIYFSRSAKNDKTLITKIIKNNPAFARTQNNAVLKPSKPIKRTKKRLIAHSNNETAKNMCLNIPVEMPAMDKSLLNTPCLNPAYTTVAMTNKYESLQGLKDF